MTVHFVTHEALSDLRRSVYPRATRWTISNSRAVNEGGVGSPRAHCEQPLRFDPLAKHDRTVSATSTAPAVFGRYASGACGGRGAEMERVVMRRERDDP